MTALLSLALLASPSIVRVHPIGGQRGSEVQVEITGEKLSRATGVEFDTPHIRWERTICAEEKKLTGVIAIAPEALLGPHLVRVLTRDGHSTTALFNVGQFPSHWKQGPVPGLPVEIYGSLDTLEQSDDYRVEVKARERIAFDLKSTDIGSALEAKMFLLDANGKRIAFSDDRDDFDDTPYIERTFEKPGVVVVRVEQYRGPRQAPTKNNPYILRISSLPAIRYWAPLGSQPGSTSTITITGSGLSELKSARLREVRLAEYYRMTYPYVMPVSIRGGGQAEIRGKVLRASPDQAEVQFEIPASARTGLWRLWLESPAGSADAGSIDIAADAAIEGVLREKIATHRLEGVAGRPLHLFTLAAQLGIPNIDTVLEVRDSAGKLLAANDDVVTGVATLGNPDSSLFHTPALDGPLFLTVRDRLNRAGPGMAYRLKTEIRKPSFQLFVPPEALAARPGGKIRLRVDMAREEGFAGEVEIWAEGFEATKAGFRTDQLWEPGGDNLQMIVPEATLELSVPEGAKPGIYPIRVFGRAQGIVVEAQASLMIGPLTNLFNFTRRPLPEISLSVLETP